MKRIISIVRENRTIISGFIVIILACTILLVLLENHRVFLMNEAKDRTAAQLAGPEVRVAATRRSPSERLVTLTGEARPFAEVTLYAKVSGYLKKIPVDKGDRVRDNQLLAVIESPELDRQYDAAVIDAQDKRRDAIREKTLRDKNLISQQDADHAEAAALESEANAASLRTQKGYEILRAPFAGTVTARFADPGALVQNAASSQTTALPVVTLSQTDRLRIYVYLNQRDAAAVRIGDRAEIIDSSRPELRLTASVSRVSGELDPRTRTLLAELDVRNEKGLLLAGSFVQVSLRLHTTPALEIPAEALLVKNEKTFVAVLSDDSRVHFRPIVIADSDAKTIRLVSGLSEGETVVLNAGWGISDGDHVRPVPMASP